MGRENISLTTRPGKLAITNQAGSHKRHSRTCRQGTSLTDCQNGEIIILIKMSSCHLLAGAF